MYDNYQSRKSKFMFKLTLTEGDINEGHTFSV